LFVWALGEFSKGELHVLQRTGEETASALSSKTATKEPSQLRNSKKRL